ncbi:hypothetical protein ACLQ3C_20420 [Gordonia sp. DT30]|uniref:hypothetical protein n=1 Tax=Gordonia sp. DT30 TaxID=3416546 RepID=UPI003CF6CD5F
MMASPQTFDRWWPELVRVGSARGQRDRWPLEEALLTLPDEDGAALVAVAMAGLHARLQRMCDDDPTEHKLWLISGLLQYQLLLPEGYTREHLYRLLGVIASRNEAALASPDIVALLELVWGLKPPADPERAREHSLRRWLDEPHPTPDNFLAPIVATVLSACPDDWRSFEGTLTMAAGQLLANLTVTTPSQPAALLSRLLPAPEIINHRKGDHLEWRAGIRADNTEVHTTTLDRNATPHPAELLRISDFYAEMPSGRIPDDTPAWLRGYLTHGTIDYGSGQRPVVGPAEALDIVRRRAAQRGLGPTFDTRMLVAVRLPAGYRVYMYQPPDIPFDQLIVGSPRFYVGDDCRIYPTRSGFPAHSDEEFRVAFEQRHGYDSTTGEPWVRPTAIVGPRKPQ